MDPLFYTTPVGKAAYLGGRFLAAFVLYAVILLAVPLGLLLAAVVPGPEAELIGPFRPAAYLGAYLFLALPNAFVATAFLFSMAALSRRAMASYLGSRAPLQRGRRSAGRSWPGRWSGGSWRSCWIPSA